MIELSLVLVTVSIISYLIYRDTIRLAYQRSQQALDEQHYQDGRLHACTNDDFLKLVEAHNKGAQQYRDLAKTVSALSFRVGMGAAAPADQNANEFLFGRKE